MPSILTLDHNDARAYFLKGSNYSNVDLPSYFEFDDLILSISRKLGTSDISNYFGVYSDPITGKNKSRRPGDYEEVNYLLLGNKDGEFSWRPYELIHPVIYVGLVHKITEEKNWKSLQRRFRKFAKSGVRCESMPEWTNDDEGAKAKQIRNWWTNVEQRSLELGLKYQYTFDADITNCYGAIYTHSIAWALHGKDVAKVKRDDKGLLGNNIDALIRMMRSDQTNGIPQGSALMDFIAEIILGYVDEILVEKIKSDVKDDYEIIRYRDDYKVMTNNPESGRKIIKVLSEVLASLGMKLNTDKTKQRMDPILAAVKEDKLAELLVPRNKMSMQKWLLQIYTTAHLHPNSGKVSRMLTRYYDALNGTKKLGEFDNPKVMLSIAVNLALKNPKSYQWCMAVISKLLDFCEPADRVKLLADIRSKFDRIPNTGLLDVWLQRISYKIDPSIRYAENRLTLLLSSVIYPGNIFWQSSWLKPDVANLVIDTPIIKRSVLNEMPATIDRAEVELFKRRYQ